MRPIIAGATVDVPAGLSNVELKRLSRLATNIATRPQARSPSAVGGQIGFNVGAAAGLGLTWPSEADGNRTRYFTRRTVNVPSGITLAFPGQFVVGVSPVNTTGLNPAFMIPVTEGQRLTLSFALQFTLANVLGTVSVDRGWFNSAGDRIMVNLQTGLMSNIPRGTWVSYRDTTAIAPSGTVGMGLRVLGGYTGTVAANAGVGDTFDFADLLLTVDEYDGSYFDGDSPNARWTGAPNGSTSELYGLVGAGVNVTAAFTDPMEGTQ